MNNPAPNQYTCYFMISPTPAEAPDGIVDTRPNGRGRMFYIKFGDGIWGTENGRYTTHNPSFRPGHNDNCANIVGGNKYYLDNNNNNPPTYVNPGTYLKNKVLDANFEQYMHGEWFHIHPGPGGMTQLVADLEWISRQVDDATKDFGYQAALQAYNNGQNLQARRAAATAALRAIAVTGYNLPNGAHVCGFLERLIAHGHN